MRRTPHFTTAGIDDARVIGMLIAHGAYINALDISFLPRTGLTVTVARGCIYAVKALLEHGTDINVPCCALDSVSLYN